MLLYIIILLYFTKRKPLQNMKNAFFSLKPLFSFSKYRKYSNSRLLLKLFHLKWKLKNGIIMESRYVLHKLENVWILINPKPF